MEVAIYFERAFFYLKLDQLEKAKVDLHIANKIEPAIFTDYLSADLKIDEIIVLFQLSKSIEERNRQSD